MSRILIIEDEVAIADLERDYLELSDFQVDICNTGDEGLAAALAGEYDLVILDLMLPGMDGFEVCRKIREEKNIPILMVSAKKDDIDKIRGLGLGADDYMTKPFPISVFRKKVSVLLGRIQKQTGGDRYTNGTLSINFSELTAELSGSPITFTPLEYRLLKVLVRNPKIVLTRQVLLEKLWDVDENFVDEHTLTVTISRIRSKIEVDGLQYIKTVYGMGYMWIGGLKK